MSNTNIGKIVVAFFFGMLSSALALALFETRSGLEYKFRDRIYLQFEGFQYVTLPEKKMIVHVVTDSGGDGAACALSIGSARQQMFELSTNEAIIYVNDGYMAMAVAVGSGCSRNVRLILTKGDS